MMQSVQMNFQSDAKFASNLWKCKCDSMDTQYHLENICPLYDDIRKDKDLSDDNDLVAFFQQVIARRQEEEDNQTEPKRLPSTDS